MTASSTSLASTFPETTSASSSSSLTASSSSQASVAIGPVRPSTSADEDPPYLKESLKQLHELAVFNNIVERYEQEQDKKTKAFTVTLRFGTETYQVRAQWSLTHCT